eukprot:s386_g14.t1
MEAPLRQAAGSRQGLGTSAVPGIVPGNHGQEDLHGEAQSPCQERRQQTLSQVSSQGVSTATPTRLPAPGVQEVRQSSRKLCNVSQMPCQMEVGRHRMEVAWLLVQVVAASAIFLDNGGRLNTGAGLPFEPAVPGSSGQQSQAQAWPSCQAGDFEDERITKITATFDDILSGGPSASGRRDPGLRPGHERGSAQPLQLVGRRKRLTGDLKKTIQALEAEVYVMQHLPHERNKKHVVDVFELFAGSAKATRMAGQYGLNALEPIDKIDGKDLGFPCTFWNLMNENCNYSWRLDELEALRDLERPLLQRVADRIKQQALAGRFFALENSAKSRLWDEPCVTELMDLPDAQLVTLDAGAFGATDKDGFPIIKTHKFLVHKFLVNSPALAQALHRRLSAQECQVCKPLEGINALVDVDHRALRCKVKTRTELLEKVLLISFKMRRQASWSSTGCANQTSKGFSKRMGLSFLASFLTNLKIVRANSSGYTWTQIPWSSKDPASGSQSISSSTPCEHRPSHKKELIRLLSSYGSINSATLTAIHHMVCGSCERTKPPAPPRPASVPQFMGQFGERVQLDIVYIRDLAGANHPVLGMVDMATLLQQAVRLHSRASAHVADQFRRSWLMPYGYPLVCEVDADGAFEGDFRTALEDAGVHYVVIPPEAHWRIGIVERRNAVLRTAAERLIDENPVINGEGVDWILISTVQALNSSTSSKGRSPYQAVFG